MRDTPIRRFLAGLKQPSGFNADGRPLGTGLAAALRTQRDDRPAVVEMSEHADDQEMLNR
ncbi:hypothetical protein J2S43_001755 [Catenuloplanes nepalensis]|uniref:Uncharacterized protein n=1 Tax=Catenuloplanes nepalensis TaxID=587533 RepID=A0ABT9MPC1_9ACTN|nr:hypothetical protein [Catenuloplanes nepalensis]MDP9793243.1 hypothetical protein [Catenuloplanes nepalensis]